jgi:DNA recombination protein RmuC
MTEMMLLSVLTGICLVAAVAAIAALIKAGALSKQLDEFRKSDQNTTAMLQAFGELISRNQRDSAENMDRRLADINTRFSQMALENNRQLEEMRKTVDEKLQKTLDERITQSFKLVNDRLEQVYKGLGEMQNLAVGVGDLKKVLSNVKTRGILGEVQLGAILEQILAPEQYAENVITKSTGADRVEFAVKLPGDDERTVWLPIDAKFPADSYSRLVDAYELGDAAAIEEAAKNLEKVIKSEAKDIHTKYIEPPYTTDFGIMFLPFEGLYAEVVRRGLLDVLQREYKVNIAGPTTMAALLNSLQMGFKTLAIQKHSGEVWEVLGAVKTEFANFSKVLGNARNRIRMADEELEKLIGTRTRAIERKLRGVESLTAAESVDVLDLPDLSDI